MQLPFQTRLPRHLMTPAVYRARAAIRMDIARQDDALGDAGARDRNLRAATVLEAEANKTEKGR